MGVLLLACAIRIMRVTWRVRVHGARVEGARVLAFWHGDQVCLAALRRWSGGAPSVLVSRSQDGELAAGVARSLGLGVVRGSSSRGARSGAVALGRRLKEGGVVALAVDGPRGPRREAGESAARLARATGTLIAPVIARASRAFELSSWDRMTIPWPFAAVHIFWGEPRAAGVAEGLESVETCARAVLQARVA